MGVAGIMFVHTTRALILMSCSRNSTINILIVFIPVRIQLSPISVHRVIRRCVLEASGRTMISPPIVLTRVLLFTLV